MMTMKIQPRLTQEQGTIIVIMINNGSENRMRCQLANCSSEH